MKLTGKDLLKLIDSNDIRCLIQLRNIINDAYQAAINHRFVKVQIMNREGNTLMMRQKIKETLPQFKYEWHGEAGTIGEFTFYIPRSEWNDEIKAKCESLDSFVGTHQETAVRYRLKEDTPQRLKDLYGTADNQRLRDLKNHMQFNCDDQEVRQYIEEYTVVTRTWTDKLVVEDLDLDYEYFKDHSNWEITF